jgi:hypothetical protein
MHIHSSLLESVFLLLTVALVTTVSAKVACFKSTGELRNAVKEYAFDGAGGESTLAAKKYGVRAPRLEVVLACIERT